MLFCGSRKNYFFTSFQTQKKLKLSNNQIGDNGAQQIADVIRKNTVSNFFSLTYLVRTYFSLT
jgi:hypothetical protein